MFGLLGSFFSGELTIDTNSWHFRWYNYWQEKGGYNKRGYRENFCHYVRVLVIWAPIRWFLYANVFRVIKPWTVTLTTAFLAFVGISFYIWPDVSLRVLLTFLAILGIVAAVLVVVGVAAYIITENEETAKKALIYASAPIWFPLLLLAIGLDESWKRVLKPYGEAYLLPFLAWFFTAHILWVVYPWSVLASTGLALSFVFATNGAIVFSIWAGVILGVAAVLTVLVFAAIIAYDYLKEKRQEARRRQPRYVPVSKEPSRVVRFMDAAVDTLKVTGHYVMARKRRVCPLINFEANQQEPGLRAVS